MNCTETENDSLLIHINGKEDVFAVPIIRGDFFEQ